jgi:hypothetical protein
MVKRAGVLLDPKGFPCDFLWVYIKDLIYSIPIDAIEENGWKMLPQQFAITQVC